MDKQLYEALDRLEELDFTNIEDKIFAALTSHRKERKAMVLDVTDTYFNGSQADWKARKGKDGKYDKLVQVALALTKEEGGSPFCITCMKAILVTVRYFRIR